MVGERRISSLSGEKLRWVMKTILVVEDDAHQLLLYGQELSLEGYNVITVEDGGKALNKMKEYSIDLVVMEIMLFGVNGIELMDSILREHLEIPIIINTAYSGYKNDLTLMADAYIIKSSDLSELKRTIKRFFEIKELADGAE